MSNIKYPTAFLQRMQTQLGNGFDTFIETLNGSSPTSIRLNPYKKTAQFDAAAQVPWCANGKYLAERPSFTFDPLFHAGTYYVQEAGSMYVEQAYMLANPENKAVRVLDMCAAPGGKTMQLAATGADALGVEEQANLPGTVDTHPNWRRRLPGEAASLLDNAGAARRLELLAVARNQAHERDR